MSCSSLSAQEESGERLTVERVFELLDELTLSNDAHRGWYGEEGSFLAVEDAEAGKRLVVVDPESDRTRELFDRRRMQEAFAALPGISNGTAESWSRRTSFRFSKDSSRVLLNEKNDLFAYTLGNPHAARLTSDPDEEVGETFSPDGELVAFIQDYNLHVVGSNGGTPRALTKDGDPNHLYGRLDWVYQEELYGRGSWQAYWWSPDSERIAMLVLDETPVPEYTIVDHRKIRPDKEVWRYPKAGDPNPSVRVCVVDVAGGEPVFVDLSRYAASEFLVVRLGWTPDGDEVVIQVQDRIQTWIDLVLADPESGEIERILHDETGVWIEPNDGPWWIEDGQKFLWLSERGGFAHLYLYDRKGQPIRRLTRGPWEVDEVHGFDPQSGKVFFSADREDVKGRQLFTVGLDGAGLQPVFNLPGTHSISMSPDFAFFRDRFSSSTEAPRLLLGRLSDGSLRGLDEVDPKIADQAGLVAPEFVKVPTRDGFEMEAMMVKPRGFDPSKRYPVMCYTYSGPHAPQVRDTYFDRNGLFHQMLAQEGYLIWICDNRSASGKGLASAKGIYRDMGTSELRDLEDGLDWLIAQGYADPDRIGLWGWSYGGYMTAFALTHSKRFKLGIVGAPVTDWRHYDSIYTERYMDRPQSNPEGYARSSVVEAAANLSGKALLIHGEIDENVHAQNTMRFAEALQNAGKPFQMMIYPGNRHRIVRPKQHLHLYETMAQFIRDNL
jgi:dipeptidyl-peptidase-4